MPAMMAGIGTTRQQRPGDGRPDRRGLLLHRAAVGIDDGHFAELQVADRLLDLLQVADHHPGQGLGVDRRRGGLDLVDGQALDLGLALEDVVVGTAEAACPGSHSP